MIHKPCDLQAGSDGTRIGMQFRYDVQPDASVNAFKPKQLTDFTGIRAAQLGAVFHDKYAQLRGSPHAAVVWEVGSSKLMCL